MTATTHKRTLREIAKFAAGLIAADMMVLIWLRMADLLPMMMLGFQFDHAHANLAILFDALLLLLLVHYAWHPDILEPTVGRRALFITVGIMTGIVATVHFVRIAFGFPLVLGSWQAPMWLSWIGALVTAFISYTSFHYMK